MKFYFLFVFFFLYGFVNAQPGGFHCFFEISVPITDNGKKVTIVSNESNIDSLIQINPQNPVYAVQPIHSRELKYKIRGYPSKVNNIYRFEYNPYLKITYDEVNSRCLWELGFFIIKYQAGLKDTMIVVFRNLPLGKKYFCNLNFHKGLFLIEALSTYIADKIIYKNSDSVIDISPNQKYDYFVKTPESYFELFGSSTYNNKEIYPYFHHYLHPDLMIHLYVLNEKNEKIDFYQNGTSLGAFKYYWKEIDERKAMRDSILPRHSLTFFSVDSAYTLRFFPFHNRQIPNGVQVNWVNTDSVLAISYFPDIPYFIIITHITKSGKKEMMSLLGRGNIFFIPFVPGNYCTELSDFTNSEAFDFCFTTLLQFTRWEEQILTYVEENSVFKNTSTPFEIYRKLFIENYKM